MSDENNAGEPGGGTPSNMAPVSPDQEREKQEQFIRALQESMAQRERFLQLEFKAKKAYECSLNISKPRKRLDEKLQEQIGKALNEVQMEELQRQLNRDPPEVEMVPHLLVLAQHSLVDALPPRHQAALLKQFQSAMGDSIDPNVSASHISMHIRSIMQKVIEFGAPSRAEELEEQLRMRCAAVDQCSPTLGEAVAACFRFVFEEIKQLHEDVAQYTLLMVSDDLKRNAATYIRNFISSCLNSPSTWRSTIEFLKRNYHSAEVTEWIESRLTPNPTALSPAQQRLRGAVMVGALDLLRSGRRNGANRWADLPAEAFYFDKVLIFEGANAVQESTLLLLLEGAVSSIFKGKGWTSADTTRMLHTLHTKILSLFATDLRLEDLKREVIAFIHQLLEESDQAEKKTLTGDEEIMVSSLMEKMADTEGPLYVSFERKVLQFVSRKLKNDHDVPPLGLVTPSLTHTTTVLAKGLSFNWEVYMPYYLELLPLVSAVPAPASC